MNFSKLYLEYCEIMGLQPNKRDEMIFNAGKNFTRLEQREKSSKRKLNSDGVLPLTDEERTEFSKLFIRGGFC